MKMPGDSAPSAVGGVFSVGVAWMVAAAVSVPFLVAFAAVEPVTPLPADPPAAIEQEWDVENLEPYMLGRWGADEDEVWTSPPPPAM
ncbi:MAG: hypothetical protein KIT81_00075 [Alphaproteobacteria bacterium]|nr:hypothetical protein [Alphaproteobacteria bacterium]